MATFVIASFVATPMIVVVELDSARLAFEAHDVEPRMPLVTRVPSPALVAQVGEPSAAPLHARHRIATGMEN